MKITILIPVHRRTSGWSDRGSAGRVRVEVLAEEPGCVYDELGLQLALDIVGAEPISEKLASDVRVLAFKYYDHRVRIRLMVQIDVKNVGY